MEEVAQRSVLQMSCSVFAIKNLRKHLGRSSLFTKFSKNEFHYMHFSMFLSTSVKQLFCQIPIFEEHSSMAAFDVTTV